MGGDGTVALPAERGDACAGVGVLSWPATPVGSGDATALIACPPSFAAP
jgi:hypothetical protein